ncbi:hypothetical protein ABZ917_06915 [Nonomuraea wenchangensis]
MIGDVRPARRAGTTRRHTSFDEATDRDRPRPTATDRDRLDLMTCGDLDG